MIYQIILSGNVTPKARPRVANGHGYLPTNYRLWKNQAVIAIQEQLSLTEPLKRCGVSIDFLGISRRGDLDNLAGAILDALVDSGILLDDRIAIVPSLSVRYLESKLKETQITLNPI